MQRLGLRVGYEPAVEQALKFVAEQGRMKYVRPLYRDLFKVRAPVIRASPEGKLAAEPVLSLLRRGCLSLVVAS